MRFVPLSIVACAGRQGVVPAAVLLLAGLASVATATDVAVVAVTPGRSAAVAIDGAPPITIGVGESVGAVTVVSADSDGARLRVDGVERTLPLVAMEGGGGHLPSMDTVTLGADGRGHFVADGTINGRTVRMLVDTGASLTTLSRSEADRIGLGYRNGARARVSTANGVVEGWQISLGSVGVGSVTVRNVEAMVLDTDLQIVLLGMSYLDRFDLERQGSRLVLRRRR
jgi:aspartyl protease family protein